MNSDKLSLEYLLSDESFINYCRNSSAEDCEKWESFIKDHPEHLALVKNAKERFLLMFNVIAIEDRNEQEVRLLNRLNASESVPVIQIKHYGNKKPGNIYTLFIKISAVAAIACLVIFFFVSSKLDKKKENQKSFVTMNGERKNFQLPDGSVVTLNAGSKINILKNFGVSNRDVFLEGEAFFDVKHNKDLPFVVHTLTMDVKALGTVFDVKAYPGDVVTETSLVSGRVEVTLKKEHDRKVVLYPNQKVEWQLREAKVDPSPKGLISGVNAIKQITKNDVGDLEETAWTQNKLEFSDKSFEDIAELLERWYGVKIEIKDDTVRHYHFTGVFEREKLANVFLVLKESRSFNVEIKNEEPMTVEISK